MLVNVPFPLPQAHGNFTMPPGSSRHMQVRLVNAGKKASPHSFRLTQYWDLRFSVWQNDKKHPLLMSLGPLQSPWLSARCATFLWTYSDFLMEYTICTCQACRMECPCSLWSQNSNQTEVQFLQFILTRTEPSHAHFSLYEAHYAA